MKAPRDLEQWAADYRRVYKPTSASKRRARQAISAPRSPLDNTGTRWALGLTAGALLGLAALFLLSLFGGAWSLSATPAPIPQQAPDIRSGDGGSQPSERRRQTGQAPAKKTSAAPLSISPASVPRPMPEVPAAPTNPRPKAAAAPLPELGETPEPPCGDDLQSARMLRASERELSSHPDRVLKRLNEHAARCPRSAFALEREALWIRAACHVETVSGLAKRRSRFSKRADASAYRDAIARDCDAQQEDDGAQQ